jgi:hypothetical protein
MTDTNEIQRLFMEYFVSLHLINLEEMDKFLDTFDLPKLNQEDVSNLTDL